MRIESRPESSPGTLGPPSAGHCDAPSAAAGAASEADARLRGLEASLRRRDAVLAAISHAASLFLETTAWEDDVCEVLARLGAATEARRVALVKRSESEPGHVTLRYDWRVDPEGTPFGDVAESRELVVDGALAPHLAALAARQTVHGSLAGLIPGEAAAARPGASIAAIPVFCGERWWGYLALVDESCACEWSLAVLEPLQSAAAMLGAAIYRKRAAERLRESEDSFRQLGDAAFEGVIIHENGVVIDANPAISRMWGYSLDELRGRNILELIVAPESRDIVIGHMRANSTERYEVTGRRKDGSFAVAEITGRPTTYQGRPARVATVLDVTERKRAEATERRLIAEQAARIAAESAERRAAFLAEASRVLGTSFDYQTTLATLSRLAVPHLADYCCVDLLGADGLLERVGVAHVEPEKEALLWEVAKWGRANPSLVPHLKSAIDQAKSTLVPEVTDAMLAESLIDEEHGRIVLQLRPRSVVSVPLHIGERVIGVLALYMTYEGRRYGPDDLAVAEELARRAALAVENARLFHEAQLATRARDQMLGVVAHDLRNPLGTIVLAAEMVEESLPADAPVRRQMAMLKKAGDRMNRLIQDLLDVKRMEHGGLTVEPRPVSATSLLCEAAEMLRPLAKASALDLAVELPEEPAMVSADPVRVQQVLSNLVGNAIKFTPHGGRITMGGRCASPEVRFVVADTGPGIPAEQLPHIFAQFWQASRTDKRGIGLGLAIAKGIVEAHKGRIWVESAVGAGSRFYFTLPTVS